MFKQLLDMIAEKLDSNHEKSVAIDEKIVELIEDINELEIRHAEALADAERWGDINNAFDWRTVEVNKIRRVIEAKQKMIDTLKN